MNQYKLLPAQVPAYPEGKDWVDALRWCIAVMDRGDGDIAFAAGLLRHRVEHGPLSEKQAKYGNRLISRVYDQWQGGRLSCQQNPVVSNVIALRPAKIEKTS